MDVVKIGWCKVDVMPLPSEEVNHCNEAKDTDAGGGRPSIDGISK